MTGVSYARARWYDAGTATFLSEDPLGDVDSPNLYQYAGLSPFNYSDPLGLCFFGLTDRSCVDSLKRSAASAVGALAGTLQSAWEAGKSLATMPARMIAADNERKRAAYRAFAKGGREAYDEVVDRQVDEMAETSRETAVGLIPGVHPYREGSQIAAACNSDSAFECGRQVGRTTFSVGFDAAVVYGGVRAVGRSLDRSAGGLPGTQTGGEFLDEVLPGSRRTTRYELGSNGPRVSSRTGRQARLRELASDPSVSAADRGWLRQELNQIQRGARRSIRNPPGKELAHARGREAAKGFNHTEAPSQLQDVDLHRLQHRYDNFGRRNRRKD